MELHGLDLALTGWFQVGWSADLAPGDVRPLHYLGRDLVAWRDPAGGAHVQDRHCRHLGASLAHGGCVTGGGIRCPFHGWVWGPDGANVSIPYQDRPNRARHLGTWSVTERNGALYVWHDAAGRSPLWEVPDALHGAAHAAVADFHPLAGEHFTGLRVHPQMVAENAVDLHHFRFVHRTPISPVVLEESTDGPTWWTRAGFGRGWAEHAHDGDGRLRTDTRNTIEILWSGLGVSVNVEETAAGIRVICINTTPVDDGESEIFASYWIDTTGDHDARLAEAQAALPDDIAIWDHQIYLDPPALAGEEGRGFGRMRRWARQFYPDVAEVSKV